MGLQVDDSFSPKKHEGVEEVIILSKTRPRLYSLIHPKGKSIECLEYKDHFLWKLMDGENNLATLKQEYYNKFKALPTGHITELTRRLLDNGFLDHEEASKKSAKKKGSKLVFELGLPFALIRKVLGLFGIFLTHWAILSAVGLITVGLFIAAGAMGGFDIYGRAIDLANQRQEMIILLIGVLASQYLFAFFRIGIASAFLNRKPSFKGDKLYLGIALLLPYVRSSNDGLLLKPFEYRIQAQLAIGLAPLFLAACAFFLPQIIELNPDYTFYTSIIGLAALLDLIFQLCPFWESAVVRVLNELVGINASVRRLSKTYLGDMKQMIAERPKQESRYVIAYFAVTFLWVMIGSSVLLLVTSAIADGIVQDYYQNYIQKNGTAPDSNILNILKYSLYSPLFIAFLGLFYKMLQPVAKSTMSSTFWHVPHRLTVGQIGLGLSIGGLLYFLPSTLARVVFGIYCIVTLAKGGKSFESRPGWLKQQYIYSLFSIFILAAFIAIEDFNWLSGLLALPWLLFYFSTLGSVGKSIKFLGLTAGSGIGLALLLCVIPLSLGMPFHTGWAVALPAGLAAGITIGTFGSRCGVYHAIGFAGMVCLAIGASSFGSSPKLAEISSMTGLILMDLMAGAFIAAFHRIVEQASRHLDHAAERDPVERTRVFFNSFANQAWGKWVPKPKETKGKELLNDWSKWLEGWLNEKDTQIVLRLATASIPWKERHQYTSSLNGSSPGNWEERSKLSTKDRILLLHHQLPFKSLDAKSLEELSHLLVPVHYEAGETIIPAGSFGHDYLEIIVSGKATMTGRSSDGEEEIYIAELSKGDAIRSKDLIKRAPYAFSLKANENTLTLRLYRTFFSVWGRKHIESLTRVKEVLGLSDMISELSLFRDFSASQMRLLVGRLKRQSVGKGTIVIEQGEEGDDFYLLNKGEVEILVNGNTVATLPQGSYFGEIALIQKCKRTATVQTTQDSILYSLDQSAFDHFFAQGRGAQVLMNISDARQGQSHGE